MNHTSPDNCDYTVLDCILIFGKNYFSILWILSLCNNSIVLFFFVVAGGSETFRDKQDFFYHEVRQLHQKRIHDKLVIKVNRQQLLQSVSQTENRIDFLLYSYNLVNIRNMWTSFLLYLQSYKATKHFSTSQWCKNFEVDFQGEEGKMYWDLITFSLSTNIHEYTCMLVLSINCQRFLHMTMHILSLVFTVAWFRFGLGWRKKRVVWSSLHWNIWPWVFRLI